MMNFPSALWIRSITVSISFLLVLGLFDVAQAQDFYRFQNFWKKDQQLHTEYGALSSSPAQPGWWSAQWIFEKGPPPYIRLKNRYTGQYIHNEYGNVQVGNIEAGWWSAMWELVPVPGEFQVYQIKNRWKGTYINIEYGALVTSPIEQGWWSARWKIYR